MQSVDMIRKLISMMVRTNSHFPLETFLPFTQNVNNARQKNTIYKTPTHLDN